MKCTNNLWWELRELKWCSFQANAWTTREGSTNSTNATERDWNDDKGEIYVWNNRYMSFSFHWNNKFKWNMSSVQISDQCSAQSTKVVAFQCSIISIIPSVRASYYDLMHELMNSLTSNLRWIMDTVFEKHIYRCAKSDHEHDELG